MDLITHDQREQERFEVVMNKLNEEKPMSTSNDTNNGQSVWGPAAGAFFGAAFGEGGFLNGGKNGSAPAVTPDQLGTALGQLQGSLQREGLTASINGVSKDIGLAAGGLAIGITGVKDAVTNAASQNALSLCSLSGAMTQGFAATNFNIQEQASKGRELALQQALDAERNRATELRIQLSEAHNNAQHSTTQVLLNQVINAK